MSDREKELREAFEAWNAVHGEYRRSDAYEREDDGSYIEWPVENGWRIWQASSSALLAEVEALRFQIATGPLYSTRRDAARFRQLRARLGMRPTPAQGAWKIVEVSPMYGDESEVSDWEQQIDSALQSQGSQR